MAEIAVFRILDGTVVEQWTVADVLSMRQQLGTVDTAAADSETEP